MKKLNLELTAIHRTRYQLWQLHTTLVNISNTLDAEEEIVIDHSNWLDGEKAGDVTPLNFTAKILPETLARILDAIQYSGIFFKGTVNGALVREDPYDTPPYRFLHDDLEVLKAQATVADNRIEYKDADGERRKLHAKHADLHAQYDQLATSEIFGAKVAPAQYRRLEKKLYKLAEKISVVDERYIEARTALQRADENLANLVRNKLIAAVA